METHKTTVVVVIVNYNKPYETIRCIKAIKNGTVQPNKIIVIDNASVDNSVSIIRSHFDEQSFELVINSTNTGGSGGFNTGIQIAMTKNPNYIWLLDDDAYSDSHYLEHVLITFGKHSNAGIVGAQLLDINHPDRIVELGAVIHRDRVGFTPLARGYPKRTESTILSVDYVPACCMVVDTEVFKTIGILNGEYFIHWDDIEFGYRANQAGFLVLVNTSAIAYHKQFDKPVAPNLRYYDIRNSYHFYLFVYKSKLLKLKIIFNFIIRFIFSQFSRSPFDSLVFKKAIKDLLFNRMGKLKSGDLWAININKYSHFFISPYIHAEEQIMITSALIKAGVNSEHIFILNFEAKNEFTIGGKMVTFLRLSSKKEYWHLFLLALRHCSLLLSTSHYSWLDVMFLTRGHYDGNVLLRKPLNMRVLLMLLRKSIDYFVSLKR